jgi:hypothetical protein
MSSDTSHWGNLSFLDQKEIRLEWEDLRIRALQRDSDLLLMEQRGENSAGLQIDAEPETGFRRYAFQHPVESIHVQPRTPNRPLVVQPLHPLHLAPKAKVDFYVSIPIDIQISTGEKKASQILERLPAEILSDTWFGTPTDGTLCYALKSRARRECQSINAETTARALCKIQIHNKSSILLHCTRFCLRLDRCHLWQSGSTLWTSSVQISYNGIEQLSAIDYSEKAPSEALHAVKIANSEETPLRGLIRRTFAGLGGSLT